MPAHCDTSIRVRYSETDQMGIVYYGNYFVWFEIGRVEFLRQLGCDYRELERKDGCYIVVVDARCTYRSPARYDDELVIRTRLAALRGKRVAFAYEIRRKGDSELVAEGETLHLVTDRKMKTRPLPAKYLRLLAPALQASVRGAGA